MHIKAVDLFCGAGGLTHGLLKAGIDVIAGIDIDEDSRFPFEANHKNANFIRQCVSKVTASELNALWKDADIRLLAGCCPCQPFSKLTNGQKKHEDWGLLSHFTRLVKSTEPELVLMENVPELPQKGALLFSNLLKVLKSLGYQFDHGIVKCEEHGVPQFRRRFVLIASKLGPISIPSGNFSNEKKQKTVRSAIQDLPSLESGQEHASDHLHVAAKLSDMNLRRIRHTPHNGGSRKDWPDELLPGCYRKESGSRYVSIYGRMWWDRPAPTITTLCMWLGNGRFGHPEQDRAMTLREAALLQSFPKKYKFYKPGEVLNRTAVGRMIGNAVPPALGKSLGKAMVKHTESLLSKV